MKIYQNARCLSLFYEKVVFWYKNGKNMIFIDAFWNVIIKQQEMGKA